MRPKCRIFQHTFRFLKHQRKTLSELVIEAASSLFKGRNNLVKSAKNAAFFQIFRDEQNVYMILGSSGLIWCLVFAVLRITCAVHDPKQQI